MSSSYSSIYAAFAPHIHVGQKGRIELKTRNMPPALLSEALALECRCARCPRVIHPFRARKANATRAAKSTGAYFVSVCCPLDVEIGCSRSPEATAAKARLIAEITALQATPSPGGTYRGDDAWFDTHDYP
jgi:hypothetical protein